MAAGSRPTRERRARIMEPISNDMATIHAQREAASRATKAAFQFCSDAAPVPTAARLVRARV